MRPPVKVLLVFTTSELGGAERSLTRMALVARGAVRYDLATLDGEGPWSEWCRSVDARPIVFGAQRAGQPHGRFGWRAMRALVRRVRDERYDVIYVIGVRASVAVRLCGPLLRGARIVHGIRWNPGSNAPVDRLLRRVERFFGGSIALYICNSRAAAHTLECDFGIDPRRVAVVHNGLQFDAAAAGSSAARGPVIVTVANLNPRKGHIEYLDQVVRPLATRIPEARFVFVGRDDMDGEVQRHVDSLGLGAVVELAGFQPDVQGYLRAARLFVLPSLRGEGCPTSILEALAAGVPVVAFALDGVPELVEDTRVGCLVPTFDYPRMAAAIEELLRDPVRAEQMGRHGQDWVRQHFSIEACAAAHEQILSRLVQPATSR